MYIVASSMVVWLVGIRVKSHFCNPFDRGKPLTSIPVWLDQASIC